MTGFNRFEGHTIKSHTRSIEMWALFFSRFRTPNPLFADHNILTSAHTRLPDLKTSKKTGSTSPTLPENEAGVSLSPKKYQHFLGKNGYPGGAS